MRCTMKWRMRTCLRSGACAFHRRAGDRLESAHGKEVATIAAELAMRFEQGRDHRRALPYLAQAARNAIERSTYSEARGHLDRGRSLLDALPEGRAANARTRAFDSPGPRARRRFWK